MCLTSVPAPTACPASVTLLISQIKALPSAQQHELLQQLHNLIYEPFYAVLVSGPDYRQKPAAHVV
jgi:hypothetical protein